MGAAAERIEDDLRVSAVFVPETGAGTGPLLRVRLPKSPAGPQRLQLTVTTFDERRTQRTLGIDPLS